MARLLKNDPSTHAFILDLFLVASFVVAMIMGLVQYFISDTLFLDSFYLALFVAGHYCFFVYARQYSICIKDAVGWPLLFLLQIVSLIGISYSEKHLGPLYMVLIPIAFAFYFFTYFTDDVAQSASKKGFVLFVIAVFLYMGFMGLTNQHLLGLKDTFYMALFVLWGLGVVHGVVKPFYGCDRKLLDFFKTSKKYQDSSSLAPVEWTRDRLFFHDIINHTHGLNLYLGQKISAGNELSGEELKEFREELKIIQSLIKDHYGFNHRNLFNVYDFVTFDFAKPSIMRVVRHFLPESLVECHYIFRGYIADDGNKMKRQSCLLHYPSFYRIWGNLIKNISEVKSDYVKFEFDYHDDGLEIIVSNKVCYLKENQYNLSDHLREIILGNHVAPQMNSNSGMGLESISTLCQDLGGSFSFSLEGDFWVNRVHLPNPHDQQKDHFEDTQKAA